MYASIDIYLRMHIYMFTTQKAYTKGNYWYDLRSKATTIMYLYIYTRTHIIFKETVLSSSSQWDECQRRSPCRAASSSRPAG